MISQAFLEEKGNGVLRQEEALVRDGLVQLGIPFSLFTRKRILRRQLALTRETLLVGDLDCVNGALKQLDIPVPEPNDYPVSLQGHVHRRMWTTTLGKVRENAHDMLTSVFVKPVSRAKRFTGFVVDSHSDLYRARGTSGRETVVCSEPVKWLSEYRVYVCRDQILDVCYYAGDGDTCLDMSVVEEAIHLLRTGGEATAGYALDYGVLGSGETALVEMNDGFGLGAYDIDAEPYTKLLMARWEELLSQ